MEPAPISLARLALWLLLVPAAATLVALAALLLLGPWADAELPGLALLLALQSLAGIGAAVLWRRRLALAAQERAAAAEAARRAALEDEARARAELLAIAAHEIRTPLGGIIGLLDLVLAAPGLHGGTRADAMAARRAAEDLSLLLQDLLQLPGDKTPVAVAPFRVDELMEQVVTLLRARAEAGGNRLATAVAAGTPPAWRGDATRIRQILTNMVANAIRFTEGGEIRLEARETVTGALELRVSDTGRGIAPDRLPRLFERFGLTDGGTGLGLSICRDIASRMGGRIEVQSAPGHGSVFSVILPLEQAAESEVPPPEAALAGLMPRPAAPAPAKGLPVLVVDDVPVNRRLLASVLERAGFTHEAAGSAAEALALVQDRPYAAVLMDLEMPELDGLEATRRLRALPGPAARLPVIAVTAHDLTETRRAAEAAGMDGYLVKPISLADLVVVLDRVTTARAAE